MHEFLIRRLIQSALLLWVLMTFTFVLTRVTPGGPDAAFAENPRITKADLERIREQMGLNDPLPIAYAKWIRGVVRSSSPTSSSAAASRHPPTRRRPSARWRQYR